MPHSKRRFSTIAPLLALFLVGSRASSRLAMRRFTECIEAFVGQVAYKATPTRLRCCPTESLALLRRNKIRSPMNARVTNC